MNIGQTIVAQHYKWALLEKLGEGDAGEVYLVETLLEAKPAILKRPSKSALSSEFMRQSAQIRTEGGILRALGPLSLGGRKVSVSVPALLDQSPPEEGIGEGFFIVIDRAPGYDLKTIRQVVYFGLLDEVSAPSGENRFFLETLSGFDRLPEAIPIRILHGLLCMLETIHSSEVWDGETRRSGVIWNDVKADHLYWDPLRAHLTVIDWGNGQYLEADGATKDRQHSMNDDHLQFVQEMGDFLAECCSGLRESLDWPANIAPGEAYSAGAKPLQARIAERHEQIIRQVENLRAEEADLYSSSRPSRGDLHHIDRVQRELVALGEMPNLAGALNYHARLALQMTAEKDLHTFRQICGRAGMLEREPTGKWDLLAEIASVTLDDASSDEARDSLGAFSNALAAGVADDWPSCLWEIFTHIGSDPLPDWWLPLSQRVRHVHLNLEASALTPFNAVSRLFYSIQEDVIQLEDRQRRSNSDGGEKAADELLARENLLKSFDEEVVKKWRQSEPAPPNAGVGYSAIDRLADKVESIHAGTAEVLDKTLAQPRAQAGIVLNAWDRRDFETARRALRMLLLWDPDRRRLLPADRAIGTATGWLSKVRKGAGAGEAFYDYLTSVELAGRNLRSRVGPAGWLDDTLEVLKRLRKGNRPADLTVEFPDVLKDIPWMNEHRSREILSLPRAHALGLERDDTMIKPPAALSGVVEGQIGPEGDLHLGEPLDTWVPEARGSSARVYSGNLRMSNGTSQAYAIKIMRPKYIDYSLPLFREEAHILTLIRDVPGVTPLVECGFLKLRDDGHNLINDERAPSASTLRGRLVRFSPEEVQNFLASMDRYLADGWLPYLALVKRDQNHNLMTYCDAGYTHGSFLPLRESLLLGAQICDILQVIHDRNIVYRDHKILHYYWDPEAHGVAMIDWNISKRQPEGLSDAERQFDVVQFAARALHHIMTGRPAPGALPLGPNRPEEIEAASMEYAVSWTYDDERLPNRAKEIIEAALTQGYTNVRDLRRDLVEMFDQMPESPTN